MPRPKKSTQKKTTTAATKKKAGKELKTLRGMKDILPADQKYWSFLRTKIDDIAGVYNFDRIDTPVLEETDLFVRSVGETSDIVQKELFSFVDQGKNKIALRPEFTASIMRAYINHGMGNVPQPVKLYTTGQLFRHERPQSGRLRQFNQINFEVLGEGNPVVEAQLIHIAHTYFKELGLEVVVNVNSLGSPECRPLYKEALVNYYKTAMSASLKDKYKKELKKNPLRLLDSKDKDLQELRDGAPQILDYLDDDSKTHFFTVLEYLDDLEIPYNLSPTLVRGLDYYTHTVFEFYMKKEVNGSQTALGGGGRYDLLAEELGSKVPVPAAGFGLGMERIIARLREGGLLEDEEKQIDVFVAQIGDQARRRAMLLFEELRSKGISVMENFAKSSLKSQLELANKVKAQIVLILGQKEVSEDTILIRDMESGVQEIVELKTIATELKKNWLKKKKK